MGQRPRGMPSAEEHRGGHGRDVEHVDVLGQVVPAELHRRVLGHVAGDDLAFGLGEVEGKTVDFTDGADAVDDECREQGECPPELSLGRDDLRGGHGARHEEHAHEGQAHGQFVGDDLRGGTHGAVQRQGRAGRPATQDDAVQAQGGDSQDVQGGDGHVGQLQRRRDLTDLHVRAHGDDRVDAERCERRDRGGQEVQEPLGPAGPHVLLEEELAGVGERLEQAEGARDVRAGTRLHAAQASALDPQGEEHVGDQEDDDEHGLDEAEPPGFLAEVRGGVLRDCEGCECHRATSCVARRVATVPAPPRFS